jgi:CheY-like chemotaxis protein
MTARVLVVDDIPANVKLLEAKLGAEYFDVVTANSGEQALAQIDKELPDIVLLDVMMPGKSGWEVARALKQDPVTERIKIVMVTAIGAQVNEITSPLYGADAHVDKPFEFDRLEKVIAELPAGEFFGEMSIINDSGTCTSKIFRGSGQGLRTGTCEKKTRFLTFLGLLRRCKESVSM